MPFDNRHAPIDSPHLTGEPTAPTPGVNGDGNRIATLNNIRAFANRPPPTNQPITLLGDARGRGTVSVQVTVIGIHGRRVTADIPADQEVYVWNQAAYAWELIPACLLGRQSDGPYGYVQLSDGAGGFFGIPSNPQILDPTTILDAPIDGFFYGRSNATWQRVAPLVSPLFSGNPRSPTPPLNDNDDSIATTAFVKGQNYAPASEPVQAIKTGNYTLAVTDVRTRIPFNAPAGCTLTLPQNSSGWPRGYPVTIVNSGTGTITIHPLISTIYGMPTTAGDVLLTALGNFATITADEAGNYLAYGFAGVAGGGGGPPPILTGPAVPGGGGVESPGGGGVETPGGTGGATSTVETPETPGSGAVDTPGSGGVTTPRR